MENVSKMLLIAAVVLVGVLLLSSFVYVFSKGAKINQSYDERQYQGQLELYNNKFLFYNRDNNTIVDMVSLINMAYNINSENDYDSYSCVKIDIAIENKKFQIDNIKNESYPLKRNEVYYGNLSTSNLSDNNNNKYSIYNLINLPFSVLSIPIISGGDGNDSFSLTRYDSAKNETIYKYLFRCDSEKLEYNKKSGKVSYMYFTGYKNDKY